MEIDEDEYSSARAWSQCAGELSALRKATELAFDSAASHYRRGDDKLAEAMRQFARQLEGHVSQVETRLNAFIEESRKELCVKAWSHEASALRAKVQDYDAWALNTARQHGWSGDDADDAIEHIVTRLESLQPASAHPLGAVSRDPTKPAHLWDNPAMPFVAPPGYTDGTHGSIPKMGPRDEHPPTPETIARVSGKLLSEQPASAKADEKCPRCGGDGYHLVGMTAFNPNGRERCPDCNGSGVKTMAGLQPVTAIIEPVK